MPEEAGLRRALWEETAALVRESPLNRVAAEAAITPECAGLRMYDEPLVAVGAADDPLFDALKAPEAVGAIFRAPREWLPTAASVVSVFLPIAPDIVRGNRKGALPSPEWLHARIEGQTFVRAVAEALVAALRARGFAAVAPAFDPRFSLDMSKFASAWSERHVAYVCGMGSFGLSRGLITARGMAGRLTSVVTDAPLPADRRAYSALYEYCSDCGLCARACPVGAISPETGKAHPPCKAYLDETRALYAPRYGCGKCQAVCPARAPMPGEG